MTGIDAIASRSGCEIGTPLDENKKASLGSLFARLPNGTKRACWRGGVRSMRSVFAIALFLTLPATAWAATVSSLQGQTLLNTGTGFRLVQAPAQAGIGARVVANPGGQGEVQYEDGCTVLVNPGQVYTIARVSPCQTGALLPPTTTFGLGAAIVGATVGAVILSNGPKSASP